MAATVLDVAVLTSIGVEQRAESIAGGGGRRSDHPRVAKETVANTEVQASAWRQVGRGHRVGILVALVDGGFATGKGLAGFSLGKTRGVVAAGQSHGQKQGAETEQRRRHQES